jgi:hypothetical protein
MSERKRCKCNRVAHVFTTNPRGLMRDISESLDLYTNTMPGTRTLIRAEVQSFLASYVRNIHEQHTSPRRKPGAFSEIYPNNQSYRSADFANHRGSLKPLPNKFRPQHLPCKFDSRACPAKETGVPIMALSRRHITTSYTGQAPIWYLGINLDSFSSRILTPNIDRQCRSRQKICSNARERERRCC